jgi:anti-sigma-K factor RskA/sigma-70-like protein
MASPGNGMHGTGGYRAQEARAVRLAHGGVAVRGHGQRGAQRSQCLGDRRVQAAVHEPEGLLELVAHRHLAANELLRARREAQPVQPVEAGYPPVELLDGGRGHRAATIAYAPFAARLDAAHREPPGALPMSLLDQLPPDQRAALSLILRQGRSYDDVALLLRIEPATVRERALGALEALGPRDPQSLPSERRDEIGDYLLGQLPASRRIETREYLEESPGGRAWARVVVAELRPLSGGGLPEIPAEGSAREPPAEPAAQTAAPVSPAEPARRSERLSGSGARLGALSRAGRTLTRPRRSRRGRGGVAGIGSAGRIGGGGGAAGAERSRVGQAVLLLGLGVIVAAVIILILEGVIFGGGNSSSDNSTLSSSPAPAASASSTTTTTSSTSTPRIVAQIQFTPTSAAPRAAGVANVAQQGNQKAFAFVAQGLAPTKGFAYAVWLYNSGADAQPLGFISQAVGADGRATAEAALPSNASHFKRIVITKETQGKPTHPGTIVLIGQLKP